MHRLVVLLPILLVPWAGAGYSEDLGIETPALSSIPVHATAGHDAWFFARVGSTFAVLHAFNASDMGFSIPDAQPDGDVYGLVEAATWVNGQVLVFAGDGPECLAAIRPCIGAYTYDPIADEITTLGGAWPLQSSGGFGGMAGWVPAGGPLPCLSGCAYVVPGFSDVVLQYDPLLELFALGATLPVRIIGGTLLPDDGDLLIYGGLQAEVGESEPAPSDRVFRFSPTTGEIGEEPWTLPEPVAFQAAVVDGGSHWLLGGYQLSADGTASVPQSHVWEVDATSGGIASFDTGAGASHFGGFALPHESGFLVYDRSGNRVLFVYPWNSAPTAEISHTPTQGSPSTMFSFSAHASHDRDGTITTYSWDFGDGGTASTAQVFHQFASPGSYNVTLTVTDDEGASDVAWRIIHVSAPPPPPPPPPSPSPSASPSPSSSTTSTATSSPAPENRAPTAAFSLTAQFLEVTLNAAASSDPDGDSLQYAWTLGDGSTATGATATHVYQAAGTYTVRLTVTDPHGATDALSRTAVATAPTGPTAVIDAPAGPFSPGASVTLSGAESVPGDHSITSYEWRMGSVTRTGQTATATLPVTGSLNIELTVTDTAGLSDTASTTLRVTDPSPTPANGANDNQQDSPASWLPLVLVLAGLAAVRRRAH